MLITDRAIEDGLRPRTIVMLTAALVLLVLATALFAGREQRERYQAEMDVRMRTLSLQRATILSRAIEDLRVQVRFLSQIPPVMGLVRADESGVDPRENTDIAVWRRRLEADLSGFALSRPGVEWMALLSSRQNAPIAVVEGHGSTPPANIGRRDGLRPPPRDGVPPAPAPVIPENKRHIDLDLLEALATRTPGDIVVADMDLARDGDRIADPARPLMRLAVAVPGVDGARFGALSLAVDARGLLADLTDDVNPIFTIYLLDAQENFLLHPDPARSFAFSQGKPFRWSDQFQPLDSPPRAGGTTQFMGPDGPVHVIRQKVLLDRGDGGHYLTLVVTVPDSVVAATAETVRLWVAGIGLPLTGLLTLVLLLGRLARRRDRQIMARDAWLGAIVSGATDAIIGLSHDGRVTSWNAGATRLFGYGLADAMGMTTRSLIVPSDLSAEEQEMLARVARGDAVSALRTHRCNRDGRRIEVSITATPVRGADGRDGAALIIRDISEQVAAEAGIRSLNSRLETQVRERTAEIEALAAQRDAILNCAGSAIIACDQSGTITLFNPAAETMLGYSPQAVVGKATPALFHDPAELNSRAQATQAQADGALLSATDILAIGTESARVVTREWSYICKDGSRLPVLLAVTALTDRAGATVGYLLIATDMSEQVRNAGQLRDALAGAEAAIRARAAFLASLAQEIRTPLNGILWSARQVMEEPLSDEQHSHMDGVRRAARGLMSVFNDILDYSGIDAGVVALDPAPFRLSDPVAAVTDLHGPALAARGLALDVSIDPALPDWVIGDAVRVRQIMENLVASAVKFTQGGGAIGISLRQGALQLDGTVGVNIIVSDTGTGMDADQVARLFSEMALDRESARRPHGATGLALALTHRLVLLMGGTIRAESTPGQGSRFIIDLDLAPTVPPPGALPPPPPPTQTQAASDLTGLSGARILLVEDNDLNRHMAKAMLDRAGAVTTVAGNGQEGVEAFERGSFDLVLMDMHMPVMDGLAATRAIRALPTGSHLPILALTAAGRAEEMQACLAAGMDDHIDKPFVPALFLSTLRRWLAVEGTAPALTPVAPAVVQDLPILIDGIDMEQAMGRVMGDRSLLETLLEQFVTRFDGFADKVAERIAAADPEQAARKLHELRGAAGNISALTVADLATSLEDALRATPDADHGETLSALQGALTALITAIQRRPPVQLAEAFGED